MPPEAAVATADVVDPFEANAKQILAGPGSTNAVTPQPESTTPTTEAEPTGSDEAKAEGATEGTPEGAAAESHDGAKEAGAEDGTATKSEDPYAALRAEVQRDPALALVPAIRERLGLPALPETAPATTDKAVVFDGIPSDEDLLKVYQEKMKAGDELGAIKAVSDASAQRATVALVSLMERRQALEDFKRRHPDYQKHEPAMVAQLERLKARGIQPHQVDPEELWRLAVRPGPAPKQPMAAATEAVKAAAAKAAATTKAAAASAAAAPTSVRPAGAPEAAKPATALDKAAAGFRASPSDNPTSLYDPSKLHRK